MPAKSTREEFIRKAKLIHGNKYDYSKVVYVNNKTKVCIICPIHGEFWQTPNSHLSGCGCNDCKSENAKRLRYGVGINDVMGASKSPAFQIWTNMLMRCYDSATADSHPTYNNCTVCPEWHYLSNFKKWFDENYIEGYHLDKDILVKGNKVYSPETCCFIPIEINSLFTNRKRFRGKYPIGIQPKDGGYEVAMESNGERKRYIGYYRTIEEAFQAYKTEKEYRIKEVATRYYNQGLITTRVYNAMLNYKIEITD